MGSGAPGRVTSAPRAESPRRLRSARVRRGAEARLDPAAHLHGAGGQPVAEEAAPEEDLDRLLQACSERLILERTRSWREAGSGVIHSPSWSHDARL